jgi:lipopolysaccharide transport system permease protein
MLLVYTLVFGVFFKARFRPTIQNGTLDFSILLFCGLIVFGVWADCATRTPALIIANVNYVKRVVFPIQILPVAVLGGSLFHAATSLAILLPAAYFLIGAASGTIYLILLVAIPLLMLSLATGWVLSSFGVFVRDIAHSVAIAVQFLMFATPLFYPITAVPQAFVRLMQLNPLSTIVEEARACLIYGDLIDWRGWIIVTTTSLVLMQLSYVWFMKSKRAFADVL